MKSQFLQARRRWKDEPATEENWQLLLQAVAWRLKVEKMQVIKDVESSQQDKDSAMEVMKNLQIKCSMFELKSKLEVQAIQEKVKAQYNQMHLQFCDVDEASMREISM